MKKIGFLSFLLINLIFNYAVFLHAESAIPDPTSLDQERRLKEDAERQAQSICDSIFGKGRASVLANVELGLESTQKGGTALNRKAESKNGLGDDNFLLPWVPAPKSVTKEEAPKDASVQTQAAQQTSVDVRTVIKRFDLTVVHDDTIPKPTLLIAEETLKAAFDRYKSVLKIFMRATAFVKEGGFDPKAKVKENLWDFLKPQHIILLLLSLLALMLLKFFFGPLADFMKSYIEGMKEQSKSKVEMENKSETENETDAESESEEEGSMDGQDMTAEELAALEAQQLEEQMQKFEPFKYVTDENIKQLAYLLHHEEPWVVAMVISYLSADHGFKVMQALPADLQAKVALETAMYRQTSLEQVQAIDEDIKQKIDFVVGGLEKLIVILESSDRFARDNILEYLKNEKPGVYERVREHILLFEDIGQFPKVAMQTIVRELKTEQLARALRGASPELQQKFYESMSQGAVTLLKEEMEYGRAVTDDQIEEERKKIVDLIKLMEKDGKIAFRQKGKGTTAFGGDELSADMSGMKIDNLMGGAPDPEGALNAYNEGLAATEAGNPEEAVRQFEMSVKMDGGNALYHQALAGAYYAQGRYQEALGQYDAYLAIQPDEATAAWVEELRASVTTPAQ